ncbi:MAG: polymer-forming cytoskeletal protein [Candidatus Eisenbacteria bacterium]|uniref:Polymer-forming cytoskeletal protein n=1 Tax=Eiseniibacteriota bacterium TaxID=2212470 RepID=A0A956RPM3_UNCEI|nr:polymer-forming cytoskeletal protein [Candidatus Eisenbacteria bacterium]
MFGKSNDAAPRVIAGDHHAQSILQEGVVVRGELEAKGDVRLDGRLEGKIIVSDRLTIGTTGSLIAEVEANEVVVMGKFEGSIRARNRLELKKGARVVGDISTANLIIEEGVYFEGNSKMSDGRERPKEGEILSIDKKASASKELPKAMP